MPALAHVFGNLQAETTRGLFTTEQLQQVYFLFAVLLQCYHSKFFDMNCAVFFTVPKSRQDLTSILIKSANWFSDAYPVAYMRRIIRFVSNKKTHLQRMSETVSNHFKLPNIFQLPHVQASVFQRRVFILSSLNNHCA